MTDEPPGSIRLLHVDDDPSFLELSADFLRSEFDRFDVETATDPVAGLEVLESDGFNCVVSDYEMPDVDGLEFLDEVRSRQPGLPFVLFTGKGSEEIASEAISRGVTDYIQKQPGLDQFRILANRVENAVAMAAAEAQVERTRRWYSTLLSHIADYVFVVDAAGEISYCSPSVERVMGYTPEEVVASNAFEFAHPDDVESAMEAFGRVLENPDREVTVNFRARHEDGSWRELEVRGRNLLDDPLVEGVVVNARDVTDR